jgi:activator of 2-hydroxyglutaryl-CoA dehydratase
MRRILHLGLDVGSTTVKLVALDKNNQLHYSRYERHFSDIKNTIINLITEAYEELGNGEVTFSVTG